MPGIYGLVGKTEDLGERLGDMADRMRHYSWYIQDQHVDLDAGVAMGRMSLGYLGTERQPARNADGSMVAVMEGEIFDAQEKRAELYALGCEFHGRSQAELLLQGYMRDGEAFLAGLEGTFVAALWDGHRRELVLINDRWGMKPLYYCALPGRLIFASEIKALLSEPEVSRKLNSRGLAQFFTFGQFLGEDTFLESVQLLPGAGILKYAADHDRLSVGKYWRMQVNALPAATPAGQILDQLDHAFKRAVDRRVRGSSHLGLSLSGGLDARTILAAIDHTKTPVQTVCLGMPGSLDHKCAARMAELTNKRHHAYYLNADFLGSFERHLRDMVRLTDGHYLCQCIVMPTLPVYRELGIQVLLRGHAGELMHMDKAYSFSLDEEALALKDDTGLEAWLVRHLHSMMDRGVECSIFLGESNEGMEALARESLRECLKQLMQQASPVQKISELFIAQRLRRETTLSMVEFNSLVETRLPYLDSELIELLLAVPADLKLGDRIQEYIVRQHRPEFLDIVNANHGARMGAGPMERLLARLRLKVFAKLGVPGYQPYERLGLWLRRELRPVVERILLSERCLDRGVLNPDTIRCVVGQHLAHQRNHTFLIMALMIFEVGQQMFFGEDADQTRALHSETAEAG